MLKGAGGDAVNSLGVVSAVAAALANKKSATERAGALALYAHLCATAGRAFEPSAVSPAPTVFISRGEVDQTVPHGAALAMAKPLH